MSLLHVSRALQAAFAASKSAAPFMTHIHQNPCHICEGLAQLAAENVEVSGTSPAPPLAAGMKESNLSSSSAFHLTNQGHESEVVWVDDACEKLSQEPRTIQEMRSQALTQWLREYRLADSNGSEWLSRDGRKSGYSVQRMKKLWDEFVSHGDGVEVEEDVLSGAVDYLDSLCARVNEESTPSAQRDAIFTGRSVTRDVTTNEFQRYLKEDTDLTASQIQHQLQFQSALLDVKDVLENICNIPFFLCCGTALGAVREHHFIVHDADIDVGIFVEDLMHRPGETSTRTSSAGGETDKLEAESVIQARIMDLLVSLAEDNRFTCFDVCGEATKGLELRLLHNATRVPVDLNLYYPMLDSDKTAGVVGAQESSSFVWCATHYEHAEDRKHGMYRYRHAPFRHMLRRVSFCERRLPSSNIDTGSSWGFLVPPEQYFVEYFGENWRVPEKYNYSEGLAGKYKNIIPE